MKHRHHLYLGSMLLMCCLAAAFPAVHADDTSTAPTSTTTITTTSTRTPTVGTSATTEAKLSAEFANFLGGTAEAQAVVSGLRQGTAFSLDTVTPVNGSTTTTAIVPPTRTMGYGNVRITLRLAQAELNQFGITQPTTEQLSAVLLGGTIDGTQLDGILTLRALGMGWGQIAQKYGMTVGQLMGKGAGLTKHTIASGAQAKTAGSSTTATTRTSHARANGYIPSGKTPDAGIVNGMGVSVGGAGDSGNGASHKAATSAQGGASADGQQISLAGASNAGGGAKALAPGQIRKN